LKDYHHHIITMLKLMTRIIHIMLHILFLLLSTMTSYLLVNFVILQQFLLVMNHKTMQKMATYLNDMNEKVDKSFRIKSYLVHDRLTTWKKTYKV